MSEPGYEAGDRVVLTYHGSRDYATYHGAGEPLDDGRETVVLTVDGRAYNPQCHFLSNITPALGARDMVIGDLLNLTMLKEAIEKEFIGTLWVEGDSGPMTPYVCEAAFGDGMHLLTIRTINQRPNYHVVRVCSSWRESFGSDRWDCIRDDTIGEHIDEVVTAIEEECGQKYYYKDEPCSECDYEDCRCGDGDPWPAIDADYGCSWGHIRWDWLMRTIGYERVAGEAGG